MQLQQKDESFYWCAFRSLGAHGVLVVGRMKHWVGGGGWCVHFERSLVITISAECRGVESLPYSAQLI